MNTIKVRTKPAAKTSQARKKAAEKHLGFLPCEIYEPEHGDEYGRHLLMHIGGTPWFLEVQREYVERLAAAHGWQIEYLDGKPGEKGK